MNRKLYEQTKSAVNLCKVRLENLREKTESSIEANVIYNRILIEKAVLEDGLKPKPSKITEKLRKIFTPEKDRLICDWFKN